MCWTGGGILRCPDAKCIIHVLIHRSQQSTTPPNMPCAGNLVLFLVYSPRHLFLLGVLGFCWLRCLSWLK